MTVNFGRITSYTDLMILNFQECGIPIDAVGIEDVSKAVTKSVRKSVFKTVTVTHGGGLCACYRHGSALEERSHEFRDGGKSERLLYPAQHT